MRDGTGLIRFPSYPNLEAYITEYTKAKAIAKLKDEQARTELLQTTLRENLSIREIRERIKALAVRKTAV